MAQPSWIIIAPVVRARLESVIAELRRERFDGLEGFETPTWEFASSGDRSAVFSREPGSAGEELELSPEFSRRRRNGSRLVSR